jgi:hypothetical protein
MVPASNKDSDQRVDAWNAHIARLAIQFRHDATRNWRPRQVLLRLFVSEHIEHNQRRKFHEVF